MFVSVSWRNGIKVVKIASSMQFLKGNVPLTPTGHALEMQTPCPSHFHNDMSLFRSGYIHMCMYSGEQVLMYAATFQEKKRMSVESYFGRGLTFGPISFSLGPPR